MPLLDRYYCALRSYFQFKCSYLIFFVTPECNARCKMCFYWREIDEAGQKEALSLREIELVAKNFRHLVYLSISGGEPTLREDLDEIIHLFYKYSNTRFVTFSTNGLLPERTGRIVGSVLKKCRGLSLKVYISMDHIEDKHDEIRGVKGAFKKALETHSRLNNLKRDNNNLNIYIETVLSSYNSAGIFDIIDYVRENVQPDAHSITLARGDTRDSKAKDVTITQYEKAINYLKGKKGNERRLMCVLLELMRETIFKTLNYRKMILPCVAGTRMLTLTEDGLIIPCEMLKQVFAKDNFVMGNLRRANYNINAVLGSQKCREVLNSIKEGNCYCTFECAILCNLVFSFRMYPKILYRLLS